MGKLPMQEEATVKSVPQPTQYANPNAPSAAFGTGLGDAIVGVGKEVDQVRKEQRALDVSFSSADAELKFGTEMDKIVQNYKNDLKTRQADNAGDYSAAVRDLQVQYDRKLEEARAGSGKALSDPLALRNFTIRTRLQTQAATRHIMETGGQAVDEWRKMVADGQAARAVKASGNVTGNIESDLSNLQVQVAVGVKSIQDLHRSQGVPQAYTDKIVAKIEADAAAQALTGYGSNHDAGLAFLAAKLPGTDMRVGFSPAHPDEPSILNGAETQKWVGHFTEHKKEKVGADLGEELFQARGEKGFDLEKRLAAIYKTGQYTGDEIGRARQHFTSAVSGDHTRFEINQGYTYDAAYKLVTGKYEGDIDRAIREKDEQFLRMWNALGPKQGNLRAALAKEERLDPAAYAPLGKIIDIAATPGRLATLYPTAETFMAAFQGPTKHLWPQALEMYKRDKNRDTSQDTHYTIYKAEAEMRIKSMAGFKSQIWKGWDEADLEQQNVHLWATAAAEQAWAAHEEARKSTPGAKESNVLWYVDTLNGIMKQAESMYKKGTFAKTIPPIPSAPASATTITLKGPAVGEERPSESFGYDRGDVMVWDGRNWVKKGIK